METNVLPGDQLLALTRKMVEYAIAGDWDKLTKLEQSRLPLFNQIFSQGISGNERLAREVLALDEKTKKLAEIQMPVLQQEILMMKNSGKANNVYQSVQDLNSRDD